MATYYVYSGAGGTNSGADWTNAYTAFASAVTAATSDGDVIKVHYTHTENLSGNTTYTFGAHVSVICVDKDNSDALTAMGTSGYIGHNTTARNVTLAGAKQVRIYGLTLRNHGTAISTWNATDGGHFVLEACRLWSSATSDNTWFVIGNANNSFTETRDCVVDIDRSPSTGTYLQLGGLTRHNNLSYEINTFSGSAMFTEIAGTTQGGNHTFFGCDFSALTSGTTLVHQSVRTPGEFRFIQCDLPESWVPLAAQSPLNESTHSVWLLDCHSGDTHGIFGYANGLGSIVSDTGIYFTSGAAAQSWKITTASTVTHNTPFRTPWISLYNTATSAITPYFEILRDGSSTAFDNDEVWAEFAAKVTSGSVKASFSNDGALLLATPAAQANGAGTGSWTGESGTAWSGKCDSGSSMTPAENGHISGRICVGLASIAGTLYVDPQIRT